MFPLRSALTLVALVSMATSCGRDHSSGTGGAAPRATKAPLASATIDAAPEASAAAASSTPTPSTAAPAAAEAPSLAGATTWKLGELADVGPAGPATANERGVLLVTKNDELLWSRLDAKGHFSPIDRPKTDFAKYGRGPAIAENRAYWTNLRGQLLRAPVDGTAQPELIADKTSAGARVSALRVGKRDVVAFVRELDEERAQSQLWSSTGELLTLTPDGQTATSVLLVPNGTTPLALTLEGRTSMSPVHARTVRVAPQRVNLENDQVIWVGPGSEPLTELTAVPTGPGEALGLLATARTITDFGLGYFQVTQALATVEDVRWLPYPNGIDPAPVAALVLCGAPHVFYARPSDAKPRSPQELYVARIQGGKITTGEVLARSRAFNDISVAPRPGGAVLAWTADRHTWAMTLGCPKP